VTLGTTLAETLATFAACEDVLARDTDGRRGDGSVRTTCHFDGDW